MRILLTGRWKPTSEDILWNVGPKKKIFLLNKIIKIQLYHHHYYSLKLKAMLFRQVFLSSFFSFILKKKVSFSQACAAFKQLINPRPAPLLFSKEKKDKLCLKNARTTKTFTIQLFAKFCKFL